jgi:hypothetical protein
MSPIASVESFEDSDDLDAIDFKCQLAAVGDFLQAFGAISVDEVCDRILATPDIPDLMRALKSSRRVVLVPKAIRLIVPDGDSALVLSQILYWFDRAPDGVPRARVIKPGGRWLAKTHKALADEIGVKPRRVKAVIEKLRKLGFIRTRVHKFNGNTMTHMQVRLEVILPRLVDAVKCLTAGPNAPNRSAESGPPG